MWSSASKTIGGSGVMLCGDSRNLTLHLGTLDGNRGNTTSCPRTNWQVKCPRWLFKNARNSLLFANEAHQRKETGYWLVQTRSCQGAPRCNCSLSTTHTTDLGPGSQVTTRNTVGYRTPGTPNSGVQIAKSPHTPPPGERGIAPAIREQVDSQRATGRLPVAPSVHQRSRRTECR